MSQKLELRIVPPSPLADVPPYANATFSFVNTSTDVTIVFLRIPLISDDQAKAILASETKELVGIPVGAVTLPREVASAMALKLAEMLKAAQ